MLIEQDGMRRELDERDAFLAHIACEQCSLTVCVRNPDGTSDCTGCNRDMGEDILDPDGLRVGCLHDDCREKYTLDLAVEQVHAALKVRLPLGMEVWAAERARNIVEGMRADFNLTLRDGAK